MAEYLTKEEIKQWRSSLEKITLEEFAARLGKKIEEKKTTNDLVDMVLHGQPVVSSGSEWNTSGAERLTSIANRAYEKEKDLYVSSFSVKNLKDDNKKSEDKKQKTQKVQAQKPAPKAAVKKESKAVEKAKKDILNEVKTGDVVRDEVRVVFKKSLTDREQRVFDYLSSHKNEVVYAKDLANLLELPRDYVYKYIKNLRAKIEGDALQNADKGGFILSIK